jgi:hypothetical protein
MISTRIVLLLLCGLATFGLACGDDYSDEHCADIIDQVRAALVDNVSKGVLVREAIACGDDGVANRPDSFDARVSPEQVESLQNDFRHACAEYQDHC